MLHKIVALEHIHPLFPYSMAALNQWNRIYFYDLIKMERQNYCLDPLKEFRTALSILALAFLLTF